jgi:hypothetical protein
MKRNDAPQGTKRANSVFELNRARLRKKELFPPFYVRETRSVRNALAGGDVRSNESVLVMETEMGALVLLTKQMTYHHVAQGEKAGRPWMVSF